MSKKIQCTVTPSTRVLDTPCKSFRFKASISQFLLKLFYYTMKTCLGYPVLKFYAKISGRSGGVTLFTEMRPSVTNLKITPWYSPWPKSVTKHLINHQYCINMHQSSCFLFAEIFDALRVQIKLVQIRSWGTMDRVPVGLIESDSSSVRGICLCHAFRIEGSRHFSCTRFIPIISILDWFILRGVYYWMKKKK